MKLYKMNVGIVLSHEVFVEADNENDAAELVKDAIYYDTIKFDADNDYSDTKIRIEKVIDDETGQKILKENWSNCVDDYITADGERYEEINV